MSRTHITARTEADTKSFFAGRYAKIKKVKGVGRALDAAAKELGEKYPDPKKKK